MQALRATRVPSRTWAPAAALLHQLHRTVLPAPPWLGQTPRRTPWRSRRRASAAGAGPCLTRRPLCGRAAAWWSGWRRCGRRGGRLPRRPPRHAPQRPPWCTRRADTRQPSVLRGFPRAQTSPRACSASRPGLRRWRMHERVPAAVLHHVIMPWGRQADLDDSLDLIGFQWHHVRRRR
jgi:hypothetical protein